MSLKIDFKSLTKEIKHLEKKLNREIINATKRSLRGIGKVDTNRMKKEGLKEFKETKILKKTFKRKLYGRNLNDLELSMWSGFPGAAIFQTGGTVSAKQKLMPIFFQKTSRMVMKAAFKSGKFITFKSKKGNIIIFDSELKVPVGVLKSSIKQKKRLSFFENHLENNAEHEEILNKEFDKSLEKLMTEN